MKKIKLISDSTCDLSKELIKKCNIDIVPLHVIFNDDTYFDLVDINTVQMYELVKKHNILPKTAAPSPGAFHDMFKKYLDQDYQIIYLVIGSKLSGSLSSAKTAKNLLESEDIHLIDSCNLSAGTGLLLLKAAKYIDQGLDINKIVSKIEEMVPKVRSQFVLNTLDYLHKGGRLTAISALMGGLLKVKPIIKVVDGVLAIGGKTRGNIKKGIDIIIDEFKANQTEIDNEFVIVNHSLAHDSYLYIEEKIQNENFIENLYETEMGCVISAHCGKGTVGFLYIVK